LKTTNFKTYLFHNGEYEKQQPITFKECMALSGGELARIFHIEAPYNRRNTGTYLMTDSLRKTVKAKYIPRFYEFSEHADSVVTNILHRIGSGLKIDFHYWDKIFKYVDRVIPLSLGFAFDKNGEIAPLDNGLVKFLKILSERAEIGVRGEYDADTLSKYGIKNVRIIGCPSLHYHLDENFKINKNNIPIEKVHMNFSTDFGNLGISQKDFFDQHTPFLWYFLNMYDEKSYELDFSLQKPPFTEVSDIGTILLSYGEVERLFVECGKYYFSVKDWVEGIKKNNFSIGTRFHGNIAAILAGVPTLMINIDKRMEEMNNYYKIPSINIKEFDPRKPIEYYYDLADYTEFNKNFALTHDNYVDYCRRNRVELNFTSLKQI
jgi:hypothetical protein